MPSRDPLSNCTPRDPCTACNLDIRLRSNGCDKVLAVAPPSPVCRRSSCTETSNGLKSQLDTPCKQSSSSDIKRLRAPSEDQDERHTSMLQL